MSTGRMAVLRGGMLLFLGFAPGCLRVSYDHCARDPDFHPDCRDARMSADGGTDASDLPDTSIPDGGAAPDAAGFDAPTAAADGGPGAFDAGG